MKSYCTISKRIDDLLIEMEEINQNLQTKNIFIWTEQKKRLIYISEEIHHLCWVLELDVPKKVIELL